MAKTLSPGYLYHDNQPVWVDDREPTIYHLTPERNDMNEKLHYTDEEKIKRLSAWHEADKITIAARDAEIVRLKGIVKMAYTTMRAVRDEIPEPAYLAIITLLGNQWAATWDAVQKESQS